MQIETFAILNDTRNIFISLEFEYDNTACGKHTVHPHIFNIPRPSMFLRDFAWTKFTGVIVRGEMRGGTVSAPESWTDRKSHFWTEIERRKSFGE